MLFFLSPDLKDVVAIALCGTMDDTFEALMVYS